MGRRQEVMIISSQPLVPCNETKVMLKECNVLYIDQENMNEKDMCSSF